jgi:hypothetical protein
MVLHYFVFEVIDKISPLVFMFGSILRPVIVNRYDPLGIRIQPLVKAMNNLNSMEKFCRIYCKIHFFHFERLFWNSYCQFFQWENWKHKYILFLFMFFKNQIVTLLDKNDHGYKWYWKDDIMKQNLHNQLLYKYQYHIQKERVIKIQLRI